MMVIVFDKEQNDGMALQCKEDKEWIVVSYYGIIVSATSKFNENHITLVDHHIYVLPKDNLMVLYIVKA
jgi:hypothetical protein